MQIVNKITGDVIYETNEDIQESETAIYAIRVINYKSDGVKTSIITEFSKDIYEIDTEGG